MVQHSVLKPTVAYLWKMKLLSCARLFATPWIVACTKLLHPWDFQGKSTGMGCHFLPIRMILTFYMILSLTDCNSHTIEFDILVAVYPQKMDMNEPQLRKSTPSSYSFLCRDHHESLKESCKFSNLAEMS